MGVNLKSFREIYARGVSLGETDPVIEDLVGRVDTLHRMVIDDQSGFLQQMVQSMRQIADRDTLSAGAKYDFAREGKHLSDLQDSLCEAQKALAKKLIEKGDTASPQIVRWLEFDPLKA